MVIRTLGIFSVVGPVALREIPAVKVAIYIFKSDNLL